MAIASLITRSTAPEINFSTTCSTGSPENSCAILLMFCIGSAASFVVSAAAAVAVNNRLNKFIALKWLFT